MRNMESNYYKLASIKFLHDDNQSQAQEILNLLHSFTNDEITDFNFQLLSNIYCKPVLDYLNELLFNVSNKDINLSMAIYLCSQFDFVDSSANDRLTFKLLDIIKFTEKSDMILKLLQTIALTYSSVMKSLIATNLLQCICGLFNKIETEAYDKIIFLTIQELSVVDLRVFKNLQEMGDDMFLRLISAVSVSATVSEIVLRSDILWNTVLQGLVSPLTVDRKRAMYWLNRALHTCQSLGLGRLTVELSQETLFLDLDTDIIDNVLILIDSLEEKQTHLILPVLGKIDQLRRSLVEKRMSVHWLLVVVERGCIHESTVILKWALTQFLCLPLDLSVPCFNRILSSSFVKTINQTNLYFSPDSITNDSGFFASSQLDDFFLRLFNQSALRENHNTLSHFLDTIANVSWNAHALLFVAESFSKIQLENVEFPLFVLDKIGSLCRLNLVTLNLKYRQCIASFFLTGFFRNHQIIMSKLADYIAILYQNFRVSESILADSALLELISLQFDSLTNQERGKVLIGIMEFIDQSEINDINFESAFNKMSSLSLFVVLLSQNMSENDLKRLIANFLDCIQQTKQNPYADFYHVIKSVICLQQLHLVITIVDNRSLFAATVTEGIASVLRTISTYLAAQIALCQLKHDEDVHCVRLLKYLINHFPEEMRALYEVEPGGSSSLKTLIAATLTNVSGDLTPASLIHRNTLTQVNALQYETITCLARNMAQYKHHFNTTTALGALVDFVCELADKTVSYRGIVALIHLCGAIIEHLYDNNDDNDGRSDLLVTMIKCLWSSVLEHHSNAQTFWKLYSAYLESVVTTLLSAYYTAAHQNGAGIVDCLTELVESLLSVGENKFGMVHLFGDAVQRVFVANRSVTVNDDTGAFFVKLIGRLALYGPCHRRGLRFENRIERYLSSKYGSRWNAFRINKAAESGERVGGLLVLCLKNCFPIKWTEEMVSYLRLADREIMGNSTKGYKNYANNNIHRTRHRLFSALLIVLDNAIHCLSEHCLDELEQWMIVSIQFESLNSIRHMSEWIYTILCYHNESRQAALVRAIQSASDSKPAYVCSVITICRHLVVLRDDDLVDYLVLAILPLGSAQNYNIRLYAAAFISIVQQQQLIVATKHQLTAIVNSYVSFLERSSTSKNVKKLLRNFWWSKFDPIKDVCLEMIFEVLPPLFDLVEEEIITLDQFVSVAGDRTMYDIRFENQRSVWKETNDDTVWRVKIEKSSPENEEESETGKPNGGGGGGDGDVQKKIQPWITCRPDEDMLRELYGVTVMASDLVLVCSLIEKPTNIGGLARTSNIFGVGEFVVGNLRVIEDNSFKQLAVTADKWINMTEVTIKSLARFIALKRSEGYEIVGIEQTANSVSLQSMQFKSKTVLLLGNEKEGIPAELISHMDKCIQIPQLGQIRSLNVHVSGAIVLWEYMKQIKLMSN